MIVANVMDEIAERIRQAPSLGGKRTTAAPPATITAPAAFVDYPSDGTFDETYGRGMDRMNGIVAVAVTNKPDGENVRDLLTKYIDGSGAESIKALVDGDNYTSCGSVRVKDWAIVIIKVGGISYLGALFNLDIAGQGA